MKINNCFFNIFLVRGENTEGPSPLEGFPLLGWLTQCLSEDLFFGDLKELSLATAENGLLRAPAFVEVVEVLFADLTGGGGCKELVVAKGVFHVCFLGVGVSDNFFLCLFVKILFAIYGRNIPLEDQGPKRRFD